MRGLATIAYALSLVGALSSATLAGEQRDVSAKRAYARSVSTMTANDVTSNLRGVVGKRVGFVCSIVSVVDAGAIVGQCGKEVEPVDLYVHLRTAGLHVGDRLHVLGEMETPAVWVDVTGHPWLTGFVKAAYVDRLR